MATTLAEMNLTRAFYLSLVRKLQEEGYEEAAARGHAEVILRFGCCTAARQVQCNCAHAFECPNHGTTHVGTHD